MRSRRDALVLGVLLLSLAAIALLVRPHAAGLNPSDVRASTFLTGNGGTRALFLLLDELGIPVERDVRPWSSRSAAGMLVVLAPVERATPGEIESLLEWVRAGGTLVYAHGGGSQPLLDELGLRTRALRPDSAGPLETVRWTGATSFPDGHAWTADIDSIAGFMRVFRETARSRTAGATVVMRTAAGAPTVVLLPVGSGHVVAWSDVGALRNGALRSGDAALLFARISAASVGANEVIRFDEYHHGFREAGPGQALARFLTETGPGRTLLQAAVACLALLLLAGSRFGAPAREFAGRRRSPLEHVEAVANAYRRAQARRSARRLLIAGLERQIGRRVLSNDGSSATVPMGLPGSETLRAELDRGDATDLVQLARTIDDYVREVRRWK